MSGAETQSSIRRLLDDAPMSRAQTLAVLATVILSALDGYDVLSITFAAPAITHTWGIGKAALGLVLSSGLAGMALGSFFIAPFADIIGRRWIVFLGLVLMATGMLMASFAHDLQELSLWRVVTGLGIGALVPVINALAAEFANTKRRPLALSAMAVGYPAGGLIGGLLASALLKNYGWPAIFVAGFGIAVVLLPVIALILPESPAFLLTRKRRGSLERINAFLRRFGHQPLTKLPQIETKSASAYAAIFSPEIIGTTLKITLANILFVMPVYFVLSWLPQMVADAGFSPATASLVSALANIVGIFSGLLLGFVAQRGGLRVLVVGVMIGLGVSTAAFGFTPPSLPLLMLAGGVCGFFLFAGAAGYYATLALAFPAWARASGSGFAIGAGRVASAACPLLAGWLFSIGLDRGVVSLAFGLCAVGAGIVLIFTRTARASI